MNTISQESSCRAAFNRRVSPRKAALGRGYADCIFSEDDEAGAPVASERDIATYPIFGSRKMTDALGYFQRLANDGA